MNRECQLQLHEKELRSGSPNKEQCLPCRDGSYGWWVFFFFHYVFMYFSSMFFYSDIFILEQKIISFNVTVAWQLSSISDSSLTLVFH